MDVLALFGWRTCRETPFKNSFSSASLPTRRSRAAMRASYSASTSAAAVSLSSPPASNLATQILIRLRPIPWRLARACSDSPPRNSWTTWRLNSIECVRCLAMGFLLESPVQLADSHLPHLSTPRGALHLEDDVSPAARGDRRARCIFIGSGDDNRHLSSYEIGSQQGETVVLSLSIAILDCYVLVFDIARFGQGPEKCREIRRHRSWRSGMKKPNHRRRRLLRARRERPCDCCAAEQRDELAASCMSGKEHCEG